MSRILLVSSWFPPVVSGSSFYAESLAFSLHSRGHEVAVVTLDWGDEYAPDPALPFPVHRFPVIKIPRLPLFYNLRLMGFAFTPGNLRRMEGLVKRFRPQIIHCVNHIFDTNFLATKVGKSARIPVVGSITTPVQHQIPWIQIFYHFADVSILGWFGVRRWDGIVSLDQTAHEYVGRVYGLEAQKRSVVIPFGVRLKAMSLYENSSPIRSGRPQILMVGHIHPFRNPTELIRAMKTVVEEIPEARLVLAGRIDLGEPVKVAQKLGLTKDQVEFLGAVPHLQTISLMKTSHVFASWVTGPYHSLGTAPMEAMLCETPVVSDLPQDLFGEGRLRDGENILRVDSRDSRSIAEGLVRLLRDEGLRKRMGGAGRKFVLQYLNWGRIAMEMEQFYAKLLNKNEGLESPSSRPEPLVSRGARESPWKP